MISATHLHAMVVHFPIALLMAGFLSEVIAFFYKKMFFRQAAFYLLLLGALGTIVSYLAGNAAGEGIKKERWERRWNRMNRRLLLLYGSLLLPLLFILVFIFLSMKKAGQES